MTKSKQGGRPRPKKRGPPRAAGASRQQPSPPPALDGLLESAAEQGLVAPRRPARSGQDGEPRQATKRESQEVPAAAATPEAPPHAGAEAPPTMAGTGSPGADALGAVVVHAAGADGCLEGAEGDALGLVATYELDETPDLPDAQSGQADYSIAVRFIGRRSGAVGNDPDDRFEQVEHVEGLPRGSGRVTVTTKVVGVRAGVWHVTAAGALHVPPTAADPRATPKRSRGLPVQETTSRTGLNPLLHGPGVLPFAWPVLVLLGVLLAVLTQALLLARSGATWRQALDISPVSALVGYLVAKTWYLVVHRQPLRDFLSAGTYIQGFVLGTFTTIAALLAATGRPVGSFLDASTPGLFLAMAVGRPGCFLGGCCAGRPTASRWGLWSSDRRVGVRRIPVQLLEAAMALTLSAVAFALELTVHLPVPGALFVGGVAAYTAGRQLLFPLRWEPRRTSAGRRLALAVSALTTAAAVAVSAAAA